VGSSIDGVKTREAPVPSLARRAIVSSTRSDRPSRRARGLTRVSATSPKRASPVDRPQPIAGAMAVRRVDREPASLYGSSSRLISRHQANRATVPASSGQDGAL